jgi:hypothetical protein
MVIEQQISARRERAHGSIVRILTRPDGNVYGDYSVRSASDKTHRVAMRGPGLFDNYCSCPDFAVNTLGTCKHIEALLARLRRRRGKALDREVFNRARLRIRFITGTLGMRLRLPLSPSAAPTATSGSATRPSSCGLPDRLSTKFSGQNICSSRTRLMST